MTLQSSDLIGGIHRTVTENGNEIKMNEFIFLFFLLFVLFEDDEKVEHITQQRNEYHRLNSAVGVYFFLLPSRIDVAKKRNKSAKNMYVCIERLERT